MIYFDKIWMNIECPKCGYQVDFQLIDAKTERKIYCHNCKTQIQLTDSEASVHTGIDKMTKSLKELENTIKNFGK